VRYPQDPVTGKLEGGITCPVALESIAGVMKRVSVELDHQPPRGPKCVDLVIADANVDGGGRQRCSAAELKEPVFER
jgi:hypothetical protein